MLFGWCMNQTKPNNWQSFPVKSDLTISRTVFLDISFHHVWHFIRLPSGLVGAKTVTNNFKLMAEFLEFVRKYEKELLSFNWMLQNFSICCPNVSRKPISIKFDINCAPLPHRKKNLSNGARFQWCHQLSIHRGTGAFCWARIRTVNTLLCL